MTPTAKRNARKRGYHHDAIVAAQLGVEWRPSPGAWAYQAADDLGVSLRTIYRWVESGRVPQSHAARAYVEGGRVVIRSNEMTNAELIARLTSENGEPEALPSGVLYWPGVAAFDPVSLMAESWYVDFGVITKGLSAADAWALMTQQVKP